MAAKTTFTDSDFRHILAAYSLGDYAASEPISAGTVQTNYSLHTTRGRFIFRYYENRAPDSVRFECNLLHYLKARQYPCPGPLKNRHGRSAGLWRGKPYAIFEFIDGQHLERPTPKQERQLIQKVAELQTLTRGYRPRGWQARLNYSAPLARRLAHEIAGRINTPNTRRKLAWFNAAVDQLDLPATLPKGICHCDFHFSNILFIEGQFAALIDFDDANYTVLTYDLVTLMNPFIPAFEWDSWFNFRPDDPILDFTQPRKVVADYAQHRPLSPIERRHLFDVYKLSVLFDCLWYFERGDVEDFYEKRKIDALNQVGREGFYQRVFG